MCATYFLETRKIEDDRGREKERERDQEKRLRRYADTANFNVFIILSSRFHHPERVN